MFSLYSLLLFTSLLEISFILCKVSFVSYNDSIRVQWNTTEEYLKDYKLVPQQHNFKNIKYHLDIKVEIKTLEINATRSSFRIKNLIPGAPYTLHLNFAWTNESSYKVDHNFTAIPNKPGYLRCYQNIFDMKIDWKRPNDIFERYLITVEAKDFDGSNKIIYNNDQISPFNLTTTIHNIAKYKLYMVSIQTISISEMSEKVTIKCQTTPDPPTEVMVDTNTLQPNSFDIIWKPPLNSSEFDGYKVCIGDQYLFQNILKDRELRAYFSNGIEPVHKYAIHIVTFSQDITSEQIVIYVTTPPLPIENLNAEPGRYSDLYLNWTIPILTINSNIQLKYLVKYNSVGFDNISNKLVNEPPIHLKDLLPGYNYSIEVFSVFNHIRSSPKIVYQTTRPIIPEIESIEQLSPSDIRITWKFKGDFSDNISFNVRFTLLSNVKNQVIEKNGIIDEFCVIHKCYPGAKYMINVSAVSLGLISNSEILNYTVPPLPPQHIKIMNLSSNSVYIIWSPPNDSLVDYYIVCYSTVYKRLCSNHQRYNDTWAIINNLNTFDLTIIRVISVSNGKLSTYSKEMKMLQSTKFPVTYTPVLANSNQEISGNNGSPVLVVSIIIVMLIVTAPFIGLLIKWKMIAKITIRKRKVNITELTELTEQINILDQNQETYSVHKIDDSIKIDMNDLAVMHQIGKGEFGTVHFGILSYQSGRVKLEVAVKKSNFIRNEKDMDKLLSEALIMKNFDHKNVLTLIGVSFELNGSPLVVLPFMKKGDLLSYLTNEMNSPTVKKLLTFAIDVAKGMEYLSNQKIVHRDLAARNCMLDTDTNTNDLCVKVADFGLSRVMAQSFYETQNFNKMPLKWMSIESIKNAIFNEKTDVWSYGVLVWEILTRGDLPYENMPNNQLFHYLSRGNRLHKPMYCPVIVYNILCDCWSQDPNIRPTFAQINDKLNEFIENCVNNSELKTATKYLRIWVD